MQAERILKREGVRVAGKPQGDLMLHAARLGLVKVVEFFAKNVSVEYRNKMQDSLLHYAARGGQLELVTDLLDTGMNHQAMNLFNEREGHAGRRPRVECPICGKGFLDRHRRKFWMRLIPGSKHYLCDCCRAHYLNVFGRPIKLLTL